MSDRRLSWADESPLWKVAMLVSLVSLIAVLVVPHEPGHWAFLASQASLLVALTVSRRGDRVPRPMLVVFGLAMLALALLTFWL